MGRVAVKNCIVPVKRTLIFSEYFIKFENSAWDLFGGLVLVQGIFMAFPLSPKEFLGVLIYDLFSIQSRNQD